MEEGDLGVVGAGANITYYSEAVGLILCDGRVDVIDAEGQVMNALPSFGNKLSDGTVGTRCREQFNVRLAHREKSDPHTFGRYVFNAGGRRP